MEFIMDTVKNSLKYGVASGIVEATQVADKLPLPASKLGQYAKLGAINATSQEIVDWFSSGKSNLLNSDFVGFGDNVFYNALISGAAIETGLAQNLVNTLRGAGLSNDVSMGVANGGIITLTNSLRSSILENYPQYATIVQPIRTAMGGAASLY